MAREKQNISFLLSKVSALFLYIAFFGVQLFFNFDIVNNRTGSTFYNQTSSTQAHTIKQSNKSNNKQATIRLNKRFQPESIPVWNTILIKTPVCYIETRNRYLQADQFILTSDLHTQFLRGPPVVVA